jgi:hypothetical protein
MKLKATGIIPGLFLRKKQTGTGAPAIIPAVRKEGGAIILKPIRAMGSYDKET